MKYAVITAALLLAAPAFAQTPAGDAEAQSEAPFYQSIPAHQAAPAATTAQLPGGDAELLSTLAPSSRGVALTAIGTAQISHLPSANTAQ
jgi:hypothetical protein